MRYKSIEKKFLEKIFRKNDIKEYYDKQYSEVSDNTEGLFDDVTVEFKELVERQERLKTKYALDLGYGFGSYSIYMAEYGYMVDAVDIVAERWFQKRIADMNHIINRVKIFSQDIVKYKFDKKYNLVVSKDVLHYMDRKSLQQILEKISQNTEKAAIVYFVIFTDIIRRNHQGIPQRNKNEANLSYKEWKELLHMFFKDWEVIINKTEYKEREKYNTKYEYYFEANRISCILTKK